METWGQTVKKQTKQKKTHAFSTSGLNKWSQDIKACAYLRSHQGTGG